MKPVGILLVSTGRLSEILQSLAGELFEKLPFLKSVTLKPADRWEDAVAKVRKAAGALDQGRGVLVLADIAGGTPFNVAQSLRAEQSIEVIGGMNAPMVLKAVQVCMEMELSELAAYLEMYGRDHINRGEPRRTGGPHGS